MTDSSPIVTGGGASGWITARFRGLSQKQIGVAKPMIIVSCVDIVGTPLVMEERITVANKGSLLLRINCKSVKIVSSHDGTKRTSRVPRGDGGIQTIRRHSGRDLGGSQVFGATTPASMAQKSGRQSESARPEAKDRDRSRAADIRQLERLIVRVARQFGVRETLADDRKHDMNPSWA